MHKKIDQHIETILDQIRTLFVEAATRIESIKLNEKITATQLADDLAKERGQKRSDIYPIIHLMIENYPNVAIRAGRYGGIEKIKMWDDEPEGEQK